MRIEIYVVVVGLAAAISLIVETLMAYRVFLHLKSGFAYDCGIDSIGEGLKKASIAAVGYLLTVMSIVTRFMPNASPERSSIVTFVAVAIGLAVTWLVGYISARVRIRNTQQSSS